MEWLTIGQMAKLNGVSQQTLRFYDKMGLLSPVYRGEDNRYRYYNIRQSAVLDIIQYMKSLGISLKDIKHQLDSQDLDYIEKALRQKQRQIDEEIRDLKFQRRAIERTVESFERYRSAPPDGSILMEYIGKRQMYRIDAGINFYDHDLETYEEMLRQLRERLMADRLPQIYFCNAGTILRRDRLLKGDFYSTEVFVFVDQEFVPETHMETVPAGNYLCIYCDNFYKEKEYVQRLMGYINNQGYQVCGDYLCEAIAEIPMVERQQRGMFLRLQVPVKFHEKRL
ncbi:MerR family transcriptional regulator [[Clostridium] leptum]|uniref:MerR family transcriptional regulator n=1 Tax=Solibaculum mannosilyticum TaxID=2780922 RepID=A0A7I8D259_9FIRM|nr:MerR family transcriptional regulator [Solibaculum mannosilyticum]MCO7137511.1 MerR family transcriptional regulator [[Clostridium] leptum]BCI60920.1 MerR family transcriptional regulator [Solibaculum mannosilyticum]